jgi:hypothetical protein
MGQKILALSLVVVMALSFSACGGEELPTAQEIIDGMTQAVADVRTGEFDIDMTMDITGKSEGESIDANVDMDGSGAIDIENMQMQMDATMNLEAPGKGDMDMATEMYFVDNTFYILTDALGMWPTWMKLEIPEMGELPEGYWDQADLLELQTELLEACEVKVTGSEKVGGIDCYVLESNPDMEQFWQLSMEMYETMGLEMTDIPEDFEDYLDEMFRSFSAKQWIAKDTYLIMKVEIEMTMELNAAAMGIIDEEGEAAIDMDMTMLIFNYNQPVSIELPPEAEEATEIPFS